MASIDICVCTFQRPQVAQTVQSLMQLSPPDGVELSVIVIDNDDTDSARDAVLELSGTTRFPLSYLHAPRRNISVARNAALEKSHADWLAFVDDDELAQSSWLKTLWDVVQSRHADIVFGKVVSVFPEGTPGWVSDLDLHNPMPSPRNGRIETGHSGNVLMRWNGAPWSSLRFDTALGRTGGEDTDFFFRAGRMGASMANAEEAVLEERVGSERATLEYLAKRRYSAGQSHAVATLVSGIRGRAAAVLTATGKALVCVAMLPLNILSPVKWRFWLLRGAFHIGVVTGHLSSNRPERYG